MIKIAIVHPSYGRPWQAYDTMFSWAEAALYPKDVEYLIGVDDNDPSVAEYLSIFPAGSIFGRTKLIVAPTRNAVQSINNLALNEISQTSELILVVSDDLAPAPEWDAKLQALLAGVDNFNTPKLLQVSDGVQPFAKSAILFVNRAWVNHFGFLFYPEYPGLFADTDARETAKRLNAVIEAPELLFQHRHWSIGLGQRDATNIRQGATYAAGEKIFAERTKRNFDL